MTSNNRNENILNCKAFYTSSNQECNRLTIKIKKLEYKLDEKITVTGTIEDIEKDLQYFKNRNKYVLKELNNVKKLLCKEKKIYWTNRKRYERLIQLNKMEEEIEKYNNSYRKNNNNSLVNGKKKDKDFNTLFTNSDTCILTKIEKLPNELIRYIQSYFSYEIKYRLLETKYKPFNILNKAPSLFISNIITILFEMECYKTVISEKNLDKQYKLFYNYPNTIKRNKTDEILFLKYSILSLRYSNPEILYKFFSRLIQNNRIPNYFKLIMQ
jgi:hypothetical protein